MLCLTYLTYPSFNFGFSCDCLNDHSVRTHNIKTPSIETVINTLFLSINYRGSWRYRVGAFASRKSLMMNHFAQVLMVTHRSCFIDELGFYMSNRAYVYLIFIKKVLYIRLNDCSLFKSLEVVNG